MCVTSKALSFRLTLCVLVMVVAPTRLKGDPPAAMDELREAVRKGDVSAVERVRDADSALRKAMVPALLEAYLEAGPGQAESIGSVLTDIGRHHPQPVIPAIRERFAEAGDGNIAVRLPLMGLLRDLGPLPRSALPTIRDALQSDDLHVRQRAVWIVADIGKPAAETAPQLFKLLHADDALLRRDAADALQIIGPDRSAVPELIELLKSKDSAMREFAVDMLEALGTEAEAAVPALVAIVREGDRHMSIKAIEALAAAGPAAAEAVPVLLQKGEGASPVLQEIVQTALDAVKTENVPPVAQSLTVACREGASTVIELPTEARDDLGVALTLQVTRQPSHGSLLTEGHEKVIYKSTRGNPGVDTFKYRVSDGKIASPAETVSVKVKPDTTPPRLTSLVAAGEETRLELTFSEPLQRGPAEDIERYRIDPRIDVKDARLQGDLTRVVLTTSPMSEDTPYTLRIADLKDSAAAANSTGAVEQAFAYSSWKREGLVVFLRADGNAEDSSQNKHHGTLTKGVSFSPAGVRGEAFSFAGARGNGVNSVSLGDLAVFRKTGTFTIAFWFNRKVDRLGDSNHDTSNIMFSKGSDNSNDNIEIGTQGGSIEIYLDTSGKDDVGTYKAGVADGHWYHLALTYDAEREASTHLFVDGKGVKGRTPWRGKLDSAEGSPVTIGNTHHQETPFEGLIDNVLVFRRALDPREIAALASRH